MNTRETKKLVCVFLLGMFAMAAAAQQAQSSPPNSPSATQQKLPDAPKPQPKLPTPAPADRPAQTTTQVPATPATVGPRNAGAPASTPAPAAQPAEPPATVQPYNPQSPPPVSQNASDQLFTITKNVNAVVVPVVVKDRDGALVQDLDKRNFTVLENGVREPIAFFSSEPFPISAAVIIDADLSASAFEKVKKTLPALVGAFGQFDEVALWIYGDTFKKIRDFTELKTGNELEESIATLRSLQGVAPEPVVGAGPIDGPPVINGRPVDIRNQNINIYNNPQTVQASRPPAKVLNDVMLAAAQELSRRRAVNANHRIIFVISDGRENGSKTSYSDAVKILNSNQITVFGVDVGGAATPILGRIERSRIPKIGGANVLAKYAAATGGDMFNDFTVRSIEDAYATLTQEARNQYTLVYVSSASVLKYRDIDVRVDRPGCKQHPGDPNCVWVYAREGFWPLPPAAANSLSH